MKEPWETSLTHYDIIYFYFKIFFYLICSAQIINYARKVPIALFK